MNKKYIVNPHIPTKVFGEKVVDFLLRFYLAEDYNLELWSRQKCNEERELGVLHHHDIEDMPDLWYPKKGHYALVMDVGAKKYTTTLDQLNQAYSDFGAGWNARGKK